MDLDDPQVLEQIGRQIRADVLTTHAPDSCIYTTAGTVNLLRRAGADAFALTVRAVIMNAPMARIMAERGEEQVGRDDPDVLAAGGYALGLGYSVDEMAEGRWPGHLVAILNRRWMLDFSIDQASRPQYGIDLDGPLIAPVNEAFLRGRAVASYTNAVGARIDYRSHPADRTYRSSPDWQRGMEREARLDIHR